ncbi:mediator of RNA polymerase II transcription subunit [Striga asiatica]|uniref:Mediator of RNA polymerase II transcription subunit n=1 Tax=Striga asiatica TaxID=4170 RepID=A0A5A7PZJ1_STRAF|nr:mediator of RNA polymerase II transcription subunit [Striga asiatica]
MLADAPQGSLRRPVQTEGDTGGDWEERSYNDPRQEIGYVFRERRLKSFLVFDQRSTDRASPPRSYGQAMELLLASTSIRDWPLPLSYPFAFMTRKEKAKGLALESKVNYIEPSESRERIGNTVANRRIRRLNGSMQLTSSILVCGGETIPTAGAMSPTKTMLVFCLCFCHLAWHRSFRRNCAFFAVREISGCLALSKEKKVSKAGKGQDPTGKLFDSKFPSLASSPRRSRNRDRLGHCLNSSFHFNPGSLAPGYTWKEWENSYSEASTILRRLGQWSQSDSIRKIH